MPSPIVTATIQATTLASLSNAIAQSIQLYRGEKPHGFSPIELLRFLVLQIITAPPNYLWQQWLERTFPAYGPSRPLAAYLRRTPPATDPGEKPKDLELGEKRGAPLPPGAPARLNLRHTALKWCIDCITVGAIANTAAFLVLMGLMKGYDAARIAAVVRAETVPIIVAGYRVWPIASIISFSCVPVERRIVFLSAVGLAWGVYMSLVGSKL